MKSSIFIAIPSEENQKKNAYENYTIKVLKVEKVREPKGIF